MAQNITSNCIQDTNNEQITIPVENSNSKIGGNDPETDSIAQNQDDDDDKRVASSLSKPSITCRICLMNSESERLLTPCNCKGTHAFVHRQCLENWLSRSGLSHCELCLFRFATANYLRYGMFESMRIWFSFPSNRALLQSDILLCTLLTIITFGLVVISMFGMYYITTSESSSPSSSYSFNAEVTKYWTETSIGVFLGIVIFAFILNLVVVIKANCIPWFRWWRRCKEIQLVIEDNHQNNNGTIENV